MLTESGSLFCGLLSMFHRMWHMSYTARGYGCGVQVDKF